MDLKRSPPQHRRAGAAGAACNMGQRVWPGGTRPGGLFGHAWASHDAALFDALMYGWERHDLAVLAKLPAELPVHTWAAGESPLTEEWARHDMAVFAALSRLDSCWAAHDAALFPQVRTNADFVWRAREADT